jgi:predicted DNA binding CopG/RHH family protein
MSEKKYTYNFADVNGRTEMNEYIDEEEKEIIESLYEFDWQTNPDKETNRIYEEYAKNYFDKKNKIEVNLTDRDFNKIQFKALQAGIPYESLIAMLIHKYNEGKIALTL